MQNAVAKEPLPLYIIPSEAVTENVDVSCKGIRMLSYTIQNETVVLTIPAETAAGTKLEMNCEFPTSASNTEITFLQGELPKGYIADITILFVNKFAFFLTEEYYNYLEKNGKLPIQVYSTQEVSKDISIEDGTFYLQCTKLGAIQLNNCGAITKNSGKKNQTITCEVSEEIKKDDSCRLYLTEGKKIDGVVPYIQEVYFSFKKQEENISPDTTKDDVPTDDNDSCTDSGEKLRISIGLMVLLLML